MEISWQIWQQHAAAAHFHAGLPEGLANEISPFSQVGGPEIGLALGMRDGGLGGARGLCQLGGALFIASGGGLGGGSGGVLGQLLSRAVVGESPGRLGFPNAQPVYQLFVVLDEVGTALLLPGGPPVMEWWIALPEHEGDLADAGSDRQSASASLGAAVWRSGGLPDGGKTTQTANGKEQTATQNLLTSADRQTASPPTLLDAGGLAESSRTPRPDCKHQECHEALLGRCLTEADRATVRKFSDGGQPWKGDRWPEGSAGADVNPDGGRAA